MTFFSHQYLDNIFQENVGPENFIEACHEQWLPITCLCELPCKHLYILHKISIWKVDDEEFLYSEKENKSYVIQKVSQRYFSYI